VSSFPSDAFSCISFHYLPVYLAWFGSEWYSGLDAQMCDECPNPVCWFSDCTLQKCHSKESSTAELCDGLRKNFVGTDQGQSRFGNICVLSPTVSTCKAWALGVNQRSCAFWVLEAICDDILSAALSCTALLYFHCHRQPAIWCV
jgi:hypothetical protein